MVSSKVGRSPWGERDMVTGPLVIKLTLVKSHHSLIDLYKEPSSRPLDI